MLLPYKGIVSCFLLMMLLVSKGGLAQRSSAILPIPSPPKADPAKIKLGKRLYFEKLFSKDQDLSCDSCHSLKKAGCDNLRTYIGDNKKPGLLNTPTVLNSSLNTVQFWSGEIKTIKDVINDHLEDPTVFANNWQEVLKRIKNNVALKEAFKKAYKGDITVDKIEDAITIYVSNLITPDSPFDRFLKGDPNALSDDAKQGYELFKNYGCVTCHQGPNLGGNIFEKMGIYRDFFVPSKTTKTDLGRFNFTKKEEDKYVFKVPPLRNIAFTWPYMHDGSASTLEEVILLMGIYQVGQPIQPYDVPKIVRFLESLSGKIPDELTEK